MLLTIHTKAPKHHRSELAIPFVFYDMSSSFAFAIIEVQIALLEDRTQLFFLNVQLLLSI